MGKNDSSNSTATDRTVQLRADGQFGVYGEGDGATAASWNDSDDPVSGECLPSSSAIYRHSAALVSVLVNAYFW